MNFWSNPKTPKAVRDSKYLGYVVQLPCAVCFHHGMPDASERRQAHHTICGRYSQAKRPDCMAIPLCEPHHQGFWGNDPQKVAIHQDKAEWVHQYGPDTNYIAWTQDRVEADFGYKPKGFDQ